MKLKNELLQIAKDKAANLLPNTQIRVVSESDTGYWVFNFGGRLYIGSLVDEPMPNFFQNRPEYILESNGVKQGVLQRLDSLNLKN